MLYLFSFVTFFLIFIFFYKISFKINLIDQPNYRKRHQGHIPLIGGLIIYLNVLIFFIFFNPSYYFLVIFCTSAILLILGILDDIIELGVTFRLVSQLISCLIIIGSGLFITNIGDYMFLPNIQIGILSTIFTVFCVIGLTNAFNFIDGADGLCGGLFLTSLISILFYSIFSDTYELINDIDLIYILIISVILFLIINVNKNFKIFLGDAGSMFIGFVTSCFLILYTQIYEVMHPVLALWCVTIPAFDIISVIIRRLLRKKNPFKPDRRHIHHILLNLGLKDKLVTMLILLSSLTLNFVGLLILVFFGPAPALLAFMLTFCLYLYISIQLSRISVKKN